MFDGNQFHISPSENSDVKVSMTTFDGRTVYQKEAE